MESSSYPDVPQKCGLTDLLEAVSIFFLIFVFWFLFGSYLESFCRDDNFGGMAPVLIEQVRLIISGHLPDHTYYLGGGGGLKLLITFSGLCDPFILVPALLAHDPHTLFNLVVALHLALFAVGMFLLAFFLGAARWIRWIAGISAGFSGYFAIWSGNWMLFIVPFAFLPYSVIGLHGLISSESGMKTCAYGSLAFASILFLFLTGGPFPPFYSGIVISFVVASYIAEQGIIWKRSILRITILALLLALVVTPAILEQKKVFDFFGGRTPNAFDWQDLSIPLKAYLGLLIPSSTARWYFPWLAGPVQLTSIVLLCGLVPAWYLLAVPIRNYRLLLRPPVLILILGIFIFILILSPYDLGLIQLFAAIPVVNVFRWPMRALTAFHFIFIYLFIILSKELDQQLPRIYAMAAVILCFGLSATSYLHELALMRIRDPNIGWFNELNIAQAKSDIVSWYHITPHLDGPDEWDHAVLNDLKSAGYVLNLCSSDQPFHEKPKLFFYGNLGALFQVRTVHMYVVPYPIAYEPLGMTEKGCIMDLPNVQKMLDEGPKVPFAEKITWSNPLGPKNFEEIIRKTYVGAVIVESDFKLAMEYFKSSEAWVFRAANGPASIFIRK